MIIEQFTDFAGKIRILWQSQATGDVYTYKFDSAPSTARLEALAENSDKQSNLSKIKPLGVELGESESAIWAFIEKVKEAPDLTLAQYNAYLKTLEWYDEAAIRNFVYKVAVRLSERRDINLSSWTEAAMMREVRDFIDKKSMSALERLLNPR